jgi:Radical SAM superfamily/4Fe-4S single cluster domain
MSVRTKVWEIREQWHTSWKFQWADAVRSAVPGLLRQQVAQARRSIRQTVNRARMSRKATAVLGPQYGLVGDLIELDLTYACNLRCNHCNHSCGQAPSKESMSPDQVRRFLEEATAQQRRFAFIRVIGGEPTLHPHLIEIAELLSRYQREVSPQTRLVLVTNGVMHARSKEAFARLPQAFDPQPAQAAKRKAVQPAHHINFNVAPIDLPDYADADFSNGCYMPALYGMGLSPWGYYPCAAAAGIDRIFGFDLGRKSLPAVGDAMLKERQVFCRLCGHFKREGLGLERTPHPQYSKTWEEAYARWRQNKPALTRYCEAATPSAVAA